MPGDIGPGQPAFGKSRVAVPAVLVFAPDHDERRSTPIYDWLIVGRECPGVDERHRLLIDDPAVSRTHAELRLDFGLDHAWLIDHSTNGTRLNGRRIERSVAVRIRPGDRVRVGQAELQFLSARFATTAGTGWRQAAPGQQTMREVAATDMVMAVGDIVGFSTIAENTDDIVLLENVDRLYAELRQILSRHHGTVSNYVGDAFFATWETDAIPDAARAAVTFAVDAAEMVLQIAPGLDLRDSGGGPIHMGWGVALGPAAVSMLTGMLVTVLGDTTNVAFGLSGIAGRNGWPDVLVTDAVFQATAAGFAFTEPSAIQVKGRRRPVEALGARRR